MSQQLEMTIIARDQASRVVNQVQKKVMDFGKDIGSSIAAVAGPMALATMAFGKISAHFEKMAQLRKEAFDWGASLSDSSAKLGVTVEQFQGIEAAASATGKSIDEISKAFKSVKDRIADANAGNQDAIDSFKALQFTAEEIKTLKPEDVLARLGDALSTVEDPAKRAELAIAALGGSAKGLQDVLAKGFDIAGAMIDTEGLSTEEAAVVRAEALEKRKEANREKLKAAREGIFSRGMDKMREGDDEMAGAISGGLAESGSGRFFRSGAQGEQAQADAVKRIVELETKREEARKAAERSRIQAITGSSNVVPPAAAVAGLENKVAKDKADAAAKDAKDRADKEREEGLKRQERAREARTRKEADDFAKQMEKELFGTEKGGDKDKAMKPLEVSSLRAIGGGLAGEAMGGGAVDIAKQQLDTQKQMVEKLDGILKMQAPPTNQFTNPDTTSGRFGIGVA
jgi:uncharacterized phage infection (PIP) family protein YhgE